MRLSGLARAAFPFTAFYFFSAFAEGVQSVVMLWLIYAVTKNPLLVGTMIVLGYLPPAVAGLAFRRHADHGRADRIVRRANLWFAIVPGIVASELIIGGPVALTIGLMMASRIALGLVKLVNTAAIGRLVRDSVDYATRARVLQVSSSSSLIGLVTGTGIGGVMASAGLSGPSLLLASAAYVGGAAIIARGTRGYRPSAGQYAAQGAGAAQPTRRLLGDLRIAVILVFSVPSSGGLQYLSTLLVPLSQTISPGNPTYYAVLDIAASCGGFLAGVLLSTALVSSRLVLYAGLPVCALLAVAFGLTRNPVLVVILAFALTLVITSHVVCMQVLTNQVPEAHAVGEFTVLRTVVASLAKMSFAFGAGAVIGALSLRMATVVLALSFVPFAVAWFALGPRSGLARVSR